MDSNGLINSQEEYDMYFKQWEQRLKEFTIRSIGLHPWKSYEKFIEDISWAEKIGLFASEDCQRWRDKLYNGLKDQDLRDKVKAKLKSIGKWFKRGRG